MAADIGMQVTLIDPKEHPGGVCLYWGCIPTKALLHACKVVREVRTAETWGMRTTGVHVEIDTLRSWKEGVVSRLTGGLAQLVKRRGITYLRGTARFQNNETLEVRMHDGSETALSFNNAIIATGADSAAAGGLTFDSPHVLDSREALELTDIPEKLLVVGGGYIGLELGSVYASLGSKVTIVEMTSSIMPTADNDLVKSFSKQTRDLFEGVYTDTTAAFEERDEGIMVTFKGRHAESGPRLYDKVLLTVGRKPVTQSLGIEHISAELDSKGFIRTDEQRRTSEPNVYAIGDVAGAPLLAHKAMHEGRTAAEVIAGRKVAFEPLAIPAVEYTDPEMAWCGLTEQEAREQKRDVAVASFPWAASGRALTLGRPDGLTKLIIDPETERVLGVGIVGVDAGELISEGVLAVEMGASAADLALSVHPHPSLSETLMEAAAVFYGNPIDIYRPKRT